MFGLFRRRKPDWRCYARVDAEGRCLSAWTLQSPPQGPGWLEVADIDAVRIGQLIQRTSLPRIPEVEA